VVIDSNWPEVVADNLCKVDSEIVGNILVGQVFVDRSVGFTPVVGSIVVDS